MPNVLKYFLLFILTSINCFSQSRFTKVDTTFLADIRNHIDQPVPNVEDLVSDTHLFKKSLNKDLRDSLNPKSSILIPIAEVIGLNFGVGANNAYITGEHFAKISWKTIQHNFDTGFVWDDDAFITNQFAHPYHGNLYFNTARSNGYSFWESIPFAFGGSLMWELFMENEPPAINDWISTSIGGTMLGEMTYRISSLIIDESLRGSKRVFSEILAALINPARGFNRLIQGRSFRHTDKKTNDELYDREENVGVLAFGFNNVAEGTNLREGKKNLLIDLRYIYGRPFVEKKREPFDFFTLNLGVNFGTDKPIGYMYAYGLLFGKNFIFREKQEFLVGIFQHYDYMSNNVYEIGAQSIGGGIIYKFPEIGDAELVTSMHLNAIVLGASNNNYIDTAAMGILRSYNFGTGLSGKFDGMLNIGRARLYIGYLLYWLHTLHGIDGDDYLGIIKPRLQVRIFDNFSIGLEYLLYHRTGKYKRYPHVDIQNNEQRLFISYIFGLK
ncbi:MAG: DUF3943 domain-containing protein [Ignavibacteria bacterium]|nr:DUF3943 domain-containing protein [Ignavibacteria bacterium]